MVTCRTGIGQVIDLSASVQRLDACIMTKGKSMKTREFEARVIRAAGELNNGWRRRIGAMRGFHLTSQSDFFWDGAHVCRRIAIYEVTLLDYWFRLTVYQVNNQLEMQYLGIQSDETSSECLNTDYELHLMVRILTNPIQAA